MKFNEITYIISIIILIITGLYAIIYSGITGLLLCSSVSLIAAAFIDQFEIIVAVTVLFVLFYNYFLKRLLKRFEPFTNPTSSTQSTDIIERVKQLKNVSGVTSSFSEGFANADGTETPTETQSTSNPAPIDTTHKVDEKMVAETEKNITEKKEEKKEVKEVKEEKKEEFQSATNGLFKLGKLPSENAEGPVLDAGSTLLKAMGSFNPDQINAMSSDTKQLLETQKSLMGMLNQMRPVLADGKELLQTFSGMFGSGGNIGNGGFSL